MTSRGRRRSSRWGLLSERLGHNVLLKREDLQPVFSFKIRGAYNKIVQLDAAERARGVVCASAGNHAQGVALAAQKLGLRAVVVMPTTTPQIKSNAVSRLGGEVILHGVSVDESFQRAHAIADDEGLVFVHPFDDVDVIAGQGHDRPRDFCASTAMESTRSSYPWVAVG